SGVPTENAGGQKQPPVLRSRAAIHEREVANDEAHDERAAHVLEQRGVVETGAEQSCTREVHAVTQRGSHAAAKKYDQESHGLSFLDRATKKPPCGGSERTPTAIATR